MYPLGPLFHGCGLNVTAMSLNGKLNVGVISCPDLLPDCGDWSTTSMLRSTSCLNARVWRAFKLAVGRGRRSARVAPGQAQMHRSQLAAFC
jgi:hypothetical protein